MEYKLRVTDEIRNELNTKLIDVITRVLADGSEVDCIDLSHTADYPNLEVVEVKIVNNFTIPGI
jgi:hypothetical protein